MATRADILSPILAKLEQHVDWSDEDRRFSDAMMGYWVNFARSGNPNGEGLPAWPAYRVDREQAMLFGKTIEPGPLPNKPQLDFFFDRN